MKQEYATIEIDEFPYVKVTFTGNAANDENFSDYLKNLKEIYTKRKRVAILFDASKAVFPGISFQKKQAKWLKDNEDLMKNYCAGTAYIIPNLIIRNVLKTIFKFQKQPVPYFVSSETSEAEDWLNQQLR
ncbi:STAS/SEC14 domain-containing protein [Psychroflexus salis]|uniref:SpoIIAA-like n=1 Tax=Psychroflexus salis TaxID=1526574 RepID=A0A917E635_9FLAO|nr:STAS/SEC14 domain-containing protein [Psychroflexus salis]GGE06697.1 hypothetical protein GCM10010831_05260 [Psychroflexus salis]